MICLLTAFIFCNCASTRILTLKQKPGCETSVEGYYHCAEPWNKAKPAIIIRQGRDMKIITGQIVSQDDRGVMFDPGGEGYIGDPKPEYFKFDKIEALIDENGEVARGSIPVMYSRAYALELQLRPKDDPEAGSITLQLKPNERFGFCVPPGNYVVSKMQFKNDYRKMVDEGVDIPNLTILVEQNKSNYIGDLYLDCGDENLHVPIVIPYKIVHRAGGPEDFDMGTAVAGALGGAVGAGIYGAVKDASTGFRDPKGIVGEHRLFIDKKNDFAVDGKSPQTDNIIVVTDK
jgi:hypothetical protein